MGTGNFAPRAMQGEFMNFSEAQAAKITAFYGVNCKLQVLCALQNKPKTPTLLSNT